MYGSGPGLAYGCMRFETCKRKEPIAHYHIAYPHDSFVMIYIARTTDKKAMPTIAFSQRGITGLTQGRISDITLFAKPNEQQLAYDGYRGSIEAFIYATATRRKVLCISGQFPLPSTYEPCTPLPYPQTIFQLAKKPSDDFVRQLSDALEPYGLERINVGKGNHTFSLRRPTYDLLLNRLHPYSNNSSPQIDSFAQLNASRAFLQIYQFVDLFLATNTYEYKGQDVHEEVKKDTDKYIDIEVRTSSAWYRDGINEDTSSM